MALIPCSRCSRPISSYAFICPKCNYEFSTNEAQVASQARKTEGTGIDRAKLFARNLEELHALFDPRLGAFEREPEVVENYVHGWMTLVRNYFSWESAELQRRIAQFLTACRTIGQSEDPIGDEFCKLTIQAQSKLTRIQYTLFVQFARKQAVVEQSLVLGSQNHAEVPSAVRQALMKNGGQHQIVLFQNQF